MCELEKSGKLWTGRRKMKVNGWFDYKMVSSTEDK